MRALAILASRQPTKRLVAGCLAVFVCFCFRSPFADAAFHNWQVKEVFTNASGSVQFVEMFDSVGGETLMAGQKLRANSDGVIKDFTIPGNLTMDTSGKHLLIATTGFGSLSGAVAPNFTFDQSTTPLTLPFFNPNATNITISFPGSNDSITFSGALLPKDGIHSLTDDNAVVFPPVPPSISSGLNSPTNLSNLAGSVNLSSLAGDFNSSGKVDAADYVSWRKGASPNPNTIGDYNTWRANFGSGAGSGAGDDGLGSGSAVPEPTFGYALLGLAVLAFRRAKARWVSI